MSDSACSVSSRTARACVHHRLGLGQKLHIPHPRLLPQPSVEHRLRTRASPNATEEANSNVTDEATNASAPLVAGEDAAFFSMPQQTRTQWIRFFGVLGTVSTVLVGLILFTTIFDEYVAGFEVTLGSSSLAMAGQLATFAAVHSGLAFLRPYGERFIGARAWRVLFAGISLPLAVVAVFYFINHRYDGELLWNLRWLPGFHSSVLVASFVSFLFLYPSTFNLLEVAAVDKPELHLWESGVTRITRHPQAWGQLLWCVAHTAWIGSSFMVWTSIMLCAHHALGCVHGDFRLRRRHGEAFDAVQARTSIVPFAAIIDGRQQLPRDYWREWARVPYAAVVLLSIGTYYAHPAMQWAASQLLW